MTKLKCATTAECDSPVTHIDDSGYVYCASHGEQRKRYRKCRKLRAYELRKLESGEQVKRY